MVRMSIFSFEQHGCGHGVHPDGRTLACDAAPPVRALQEAPFRGGKPSIGKALGRFKARSRRGGSGYKYFPCKGGIASADQGRMESTEASTRPCDPTLPV